MIFLCILPATNSATVLASASSLNTLFPGITGKPVKMFEGGEFKHVKGDLDPHNLEVLSRIVKYLEPTIMVEVGSFRGKTAYHMAENCPEGIVFDIDLPVEMRTGNEKYYGSDTFYFLKKKDIQ